MAVTSRLQAELFDAADELRAFLAGRTEDGAVVSFTGLARGKAHSGQEVQALVLDHYPGMTERSIEDIAMAGSRPASRSCSWRPPRATAARPSPAPTI